LAIEPQRESRYDDVMNQDAFEKRIVQLEEMVTHQESYISELNQTILAMQADITKLQAASAKTQERLDSLAQTTDDIPHEPPPHY